jgi:hypothetical protein
MKNNIIIIIIIIVARVWCRGDRSPSQENVLVYRFIWQIWRDKEFLFLIIKMEWASPPSVMVTRNLNWSQRSGTETGCIKGRY